MPLTSEGNTRTVGDRWIPVQGAPPLGGDLRDTFRDFPRGAKDRRIRATSDAGSRRSIPKTQMNKSKTPLIDTARPPLREHRVAAAEQVRIAAHDAFKRLLAPSLETETRNDAKTRADETAIRVFSDNLRQLLLAHPLGQKRVLAIDPGFRTGCKVVCLPERTSEPSMQKESGI